MYTGIGMYELRDSVFRFAFLFSFLAYVNSGVSAIWERNAQAKIDTTAERKLTQAEQLAAERADKQAEAERAQQLKLAQLAAQKEVQLAKVTAASHGKMAATCHKKSGKKQAARCHGERCHQRNGWQLHVPHLPNLPKSTRTLPSELSVNGGKIRRNLPLLCRPTRPMLPSRGRVGISKL
ncbi:MAG: hypothetical protein IPL28_26255 [Chloroflexi bacterium]|nr:hypothetical protein [Chloroflexota bacterium]